MKTIKPFIDLGWHTLPLKGKLERLPDGGKTVPVFEKDWKAKYKKEANSVVSKLGGVLTGRCSNICAIDCDNSLTYELFNNLDPDYEFIFKSKGKAGKECGTIVYKLKDTLIDSFSINNDDLALDYYAENGMVYLPTDANTTKEPWPEKLPELKEMPATVAFLLQSLNRPAEVTVESANTNVITAQCLQPLVKEFTESRTFMPGLFRIITPKDFRTEPQYIKEGYLHPANIPNGRGSEYLSKISAIFGADISIDEELYILAMHDINSLWEEPLEDDRLELTIINPMIEQKATIDGKVIWQYDEDWRKHRLILQTKRQSSIELGYDDKRQMYYCTDISNERIQQFESDNQMYSYVKAVSVAAPSKQDLQAAVPIINVTATPNKPFGFIDDEDPTARTLNTFVRTPELAILCNPESYATMYNYPEYTMKFLETLVPEEEMREYLIKFLKRKLTHFEYSPIILYMMGVQGSGKDTLVNIIEKIMGKVARPTTREFLEMFNGWLLDSYFVQLDEYGNQLSTRRDKDEALGKLKSYTGKSNIQIRQMRTDGFTYHHHATFIMTANSNPLMLEDGDRRIAFLPTPNVLRDAAWVHDITEVHNKIFSETKDFCYFLATEVEMMSYSDYMKPPESADKQTLIADSMYVSARLAFALKHEMRDYLLNISHEYGSTKMIDAINEGRVYFEDMEELYDYMTEMKGDFRSLNKEIKAAGVGSQATSRKGKKAYFYNIDFKVVEE